MGWNHQLEYLSQGIFEDHVEPFLRWDIGYVSSIVFFCEGIHQLRCGIDQTAEGYRFSV